MTSPMQVFLERDEARILPIPYYTDDDPDRRFWNLKGAPALAGHIKELSGCPELREFVLHINAPASRFATLGCDKWTKPVDRGDDQTHEAGIYVDIVFDRFETAAKRQNYIDFFGRLRKRCARVSEGSDRVDLSIIRLQPQRVDFNDLKRDPVWMMSTWVFGAGSAEDEAVSRRRRALLEVAALCDLVSREIDANAGDAGTPIPP